MLGRVASRLIRSRRVHSLGDEVLNEAFLSNVKHCGIIIPPSVRPAAMVFAFGSRVAVPNQIHPRPPWCVERTKRTKANIVRVPSANEQSEHTPLGVFAVFARTVR